MLFTFGKNFKRLFDLPGNLLFRVCIEEESTDIKSADNTEYANKQIETCYGDQMPARKKLHTSGAINL
jgi:hypothetical protein